MSKAMSETIEKKANIKLRVEQLINNKIYSK